MSATQFARDGYVQTSIPIEKLVAAETATTALYIMQAGKCGFEVHTVQDALRAMEPEHKKEAYEVQKMMCYSPECRAAVEHFLPEMIELLGCNPELALVWGPAMFINYTPRILYQWHTERHYYPKRRMFINIWLPIFTDRLGGNSMSIIRGGHLPSYSFQEYNRGPDSLSQYEIPREELDLDNEVVLECRRGEAFLMAHNMPHKSNVTDEMAFAIVGRGWSPEKDLTFAADVAVRPYGRDIGPHRVDI